MAKFENEGYCPHISVPKKWNENTDPRICGLWSLIGSSLVYKASDNPDIEACDKIFYDDIISYDLLSAIVRKNVNADKFLVHQLRNGACNTQYIADIQKVMSRATNPDLILRANSNFAVILADADYGMDIWIWDLTTCF